MSQTRTGFKIITLHANIPREVQRNDGSFLNVILLIDFVSTLDQRIYSRHRKIRIGHVCHGVIEHPVVPRHSIGFEGICLLVEKHIANIFVPENTKLNQKIFMFLRSLLPFSIYRVNIRSLNP